MVNSPYSSPRTAPHILVVEDEAQTCDFYATVFDNLGFDYRIAPNGTTMRRICRQENFDLVILDLRLPDVDGLLLLREYRRRHNSPVLVASVRNSSADRAACFQAGAYDFMVKPFWPAELQHRLRNALNSWEDGLAHARQPFRIGPWRFDPYQYQLCPEHGEPVRLTATEHHLLLLLAEAKGRVLLRDWLRENLELSHAKSLDILISRLRRKLETIPSQPHLIQTVPGKGYCLLHVEPA